MYSHVHTVDFHHTAERNYHFLAETGTERRKRPTETERERVSEIE